MFWVLGGRVELVLDIGHLSFSIFLLGGSSKYREVLNGFYHMNYCDGITNC